MTTHSKARAHAGRLALTAGTALTALACAAGAAQAHGAHAAKASITGRLNAPGYTVVALGENGKMTFSAARSFTLVAPAPEYTLQLVTARGRYAGPVVVGGTRSKVIVGLRGGVALGSVDVDAAQGYARVSGHVRASSLVGSNWAWAHRGVPIGNGRNLGLVVSPTKGTGPSGPGGDADRSGIPNAFDIASDGNGIINSLQPAKLARHVAARIELARELQAAPANPPSGTTTTPPTNPPSGGAGGSDAANPTSSDPWMSQLFLPMNETVNDDAAGVSQSDIDSALTSNLNLKLLDIPAGSQVDLDCNGLTFCSTGGTGQAALEGEAQNCSNDADTGFYCTVAFPSGSLDPATGFGEIVGPNAAANLLGRDANGGTEFSLYPNAPSAQVGSGDVITEVATDDGTTTETPTTLDFVFNTVPAVASYSDTAGGSATVSYPDTAGLGTGNDPLQVAAGPNGDVVVTFTVYRPQRAGVAGAGEPAFMDIGHLWYSLDHAFAPAPGSTTVGSTMAPQCPAADYSNLSPTLSLATSATSAGSQIPPNAGALIDASADAPASPANTISFTVDVTQCLASQGTTFPVGQPIMFDISANSQTSLDHANQTFWLERTS